MECHHLGWSSGCRYSLQFQVCHPESDLLPLRQSFWMWGTCKCGEEWTGLCMQGGDRAWDVRLRKILWLTTAVVFYPKNPFVHLKTYNSLPCSFKANNYKDYKYDLL